MSILERIPEKLFLNNSKFFNLNIDSVFQQHFKKSQTENKEFLSMVQVEDLSNIPNH